MSALAQILERRAQLLTEAQAQRNALAEGIAVCRSVLVVAAATAIAALRPRLALEWSARALTLWRVGRLLYEAVKPARGERAGPPGSQG